MRQKYDEYGAKRKTLCRNLSIGMIRLPQELFTQIANPFKRNTINYVGSRFNCLDDFPRIFSHLPAWKKSIVNLPKSARNANVIQCIWSVFLFALILNLWEESSQRGKFRALFALISWKSLFLSQKYFFLSPLFTYSIGPFFGFSTTTHTHSHSEGKENFSFLRLLLRLFLFSFFANILVELFLFIYRFFFSFSLLPIDIFSNFTLPSFFYIFAQVPERAVFLRSKMFQLSSMKKSLDSLWNDTKWN